LRPQVTIRLSALVALALAAVPSAHAATTVTVWAGPPPGAIQPGSRDSVLAYFPRMVTVRVGDTVRWRISGLHTITFPGRKGPYSPIVSVGGRPARVDAAGTPFWWVGAQPLSVLNPFVVAGSGNDTLGSTSASRSSGLLGFDPSAPHPYELTFTKPGVYRYESATDPWMQGVVRVVGRKAPPPTYAALRAAVAAQVRAAAADLARLAATASPGPTTVLVGAGYRRGAEVNEFFPSTLTVPVGATVQFVQNDQAARHTVTFGPTAYRSRLASRLYARKGASVVVDPMAMLPSEAPGVPVVATGFNHGNGFLNSGFLLEKDAPEAGPRSFAVTFLAAGTYHYGDLLHPGMEGTIVVR
jgi:plastocyanin